MVTISTSATASGVSSLGGMSGVLSSLGASFSVPLGSGLNLSNTVGLPWYNLFIGLLEPQAGYGTVLTAAINGFLGQLTTAIANLLAG